MKVKNSCKKSFSFENDLYSAVDKFIEEDAGNNFSPEYISAMKEYRLILNAHFCGRKYKMPLIESEPGSEKWKVTSECDINFGNIWETQCNRFIKPIREMYGYKAWPNKITQFPDFKEDCLVGDYKSCICYLYLDTPANRTLGKPIGCISPGGEADLYKIDEYKADVESYLATGKLSEHMSALIVFCVYEYKFDEKSGDKYAIIYDIVVAPAIFFLNFMTNGKIKTRSGKVTIGIKERNFKNVMKKNFGISE